MRINILEAGLVTYLMAGKGFLPKDDEEPRRNVESTVLPVTPKQVTPKQALKDEPH